VYSNLIVETNKSLNILFCVKTYQATLQAQLTSLIALNNAANTSYANVKAARIDRNTFFYAKTTGLLDIVKNAKAYIKSVYGASSPQYHAANDIKFVRVISK
jgi:hypothetical protein